MKIRLWYSYPCGLCAFYDFAIDKNAFEIVMGRLHVSLKCRARGYPLMGRIEKPFSKWGRRIKKFEKP